MNRPWKRPVSARCHRLLPPNEPTDMSDPVLQVDDLTQTFTSGDRELTVLDGVSFAVNAGETCAIVGPSGSGKTTLLGLCAGLDRPTRGTVRLCGIDMGPLDEDARAEVRNQHVGFIFQTFRLLPTLTALENVMVPAELRETTNVRDRAADLLGTVGLGDRLDHYPSQLSGGEQQRVALARAFINRPRILFADEPTGNLDTETASRIEDLFFDLNRTADTTLVLVTHDLDLARRTERVLHLRAGRLDREETTVAA
jgi:putative ABC transport system ATP-binding protein